MEVNLGQSKRATRLFAWADSTRETLPDPRPPVEQTDVDRDTEIIIEMIGKEAYAAVYAQGGKLTEEQVIVDAQEIKIA